MSHTNQPLQSTKQTLLRILSTEEAMRRAVPELASPTVAMAISSTMQCADASNLPLWQITHMANSTGLRREVPLELHPWLMAYPLTMSAWRLNLKRKRFF